MSETFHVNSEKLSFEIMKEAFEDMRYRFYFNSIKKHVGNQIKLIIYKIEVNMIRVQNEC